MSAEDTVIEEAVDYEADEQPTNAAEEAVEELAAAGEELAADTIPVEAAKKEEKGADQKTVEEAQGSVAAAEAPANGAPTTKASTDPDDPMNLPPQGTEVFVGGIPKSATEEQVRIFCEQVGDVHSVKLAKDPSNPSQNRGFGFARYFAKDCAEAAKEKLHETEMKDFSTKVRVSNTQAKHKLYLGNIPKSWTKDQISDELNKVVKGMETFDLVMSKEVPSQNRGYAFLVFYNHECAAAAKDVLSKASFSLGGRQVSVSYAEPKAPLEQPSATPKASKAIYVGGLPAGATEEALKELFAKFGEVARAVIPQATEKRPERQFGFVHYAEQSSADKAVEEAGSDKPELLGNTLEVKAARPQEKLGSMGGPDYGYGGRGPAARGAGRASGSGRGQVLAPARGRARGRAVYSRTPAMYSGYDQGYEQGYGMYDQGAGAYDQGYADSGLAYGGYGAVAPVAAAAASPAGMTMVPMMLPTGQVGYVLQSADGGGQADYGSYGAVGPDRGQAQGHRGGGRGRHATRYRPY